MPKSEALESAKRFIEKGDYINTNGSSIAGYVVAAGLVALAEQIGNVAEAIVAIGSQNKQRSE